MFILLNGSFGIGKTTVARLLVSELAGSAVYDPEAVGFVLRRLPPWVLGMARQPDDYQDLPLWRRLSASGARLKHRRRAHVVVPMAFTNLAYLDAFTEALSGEAPIHRLCLVAPLEIVRRRLAARARAEGRAISQFELRRSAECVEAHRNPAFGLSVDATMSPPEVVSSIRQAVGH